MIVSFKHRGREKVFLSGTTAGIQPKHAKRLKLILARLHVSTSPRDMNLPGLKLHELKGDKKGIWAVQVSGNWPVTFSFYGVDATGVNCEDYH